VTEEAPKALSFSLPTIEDADVADAPDPDPAVVADQRARGDLDTERCAAV
jgi:hypothetical protein